MLRIVFLSCLSPSIFMFSLPNNNKNSNNLILFVKKWLCPVLYHVTHTYIVISYDIPTRGYYFIFPILQMKKLEPLPEVTQLASGINYSPTDPVPIYIWASGGGAFPSTPPPASVYSGERRVRLPFQTLSEDVGRGWETGFLFFPVGAPGPPRQLLTMSF